MGEDYLVSPIPEPPTCELYSQPPSHESIIKKCVSELKDNTIVLLCLDICNYIFILYCTSRVNLVRKDIGIHL